jgi:hypothetical protein
MSIAQGYVASIPTFAESALVGDRDKRPRSVADDHMLEEQFVDGHRRLHRQRPSLQS